MNITLNDRPLIIEPSLSVSTLLEQLDRHRPGYALAINLTIIPRTDWDSHQLREGDDILLFQAIAGG